MPFRSWFGGEGGFAKIEDRDIIRGGFAQFQKDCWGHCIQGRFWLERVIVVAIYNLLNGGAYVGVEFFDRPRVEVR